MQWHQEEKPNLMIIVEYFEDFKTNLKQPLHIKLSDYVQFAATITG